MKLLPDYLIKYMPVIEDAIEELRLSVIDHAYELIQSLDIDELSSDNVKDKLELYDIKTENMSNEWLPNGKFYRLFASIQHHRTRLNALKAISRSGGQFEGLWTDDFKYKSSYNYRTTQILRHYYLGSNLDGYFYISGNTDRNPDGTIRSSARTAFLNDIIMNQALPAGYTYLYLPWPRPSYPLDSGYFYNVHMLDYDRLIYEKECLHHWESLAYLGEEYATKFYCPENHPANQYYDSRDNGRYGSTKDSCTDRFNTDTANYGDSEFYTLDSYDVPVSTTYDWFNGNGTPWRCPYWFDYHYMNDMRHVYKKSWPVPESGVYYAFDKYNEKYDVDNPANAVLYELDENCLELADSESVFPSKCNLHTRYAFTPPNRKSSDAGIVRTLDEYQIIIKRVPSDIDRFIRDASILTGYSEDVIRYKLANIEDGHEVALKSYLSKTEAECIISKLLVDIKINYVYPSFRSEAIEQLSQALNIDPDTVALYIDDDNYRDKPLPIANSSYSVDELFDNKMAIAGTSFSMNNSRLNHGYFEVVEMDGTDKNYSADELYHSNDSFDYPSNGIRDVNYFGTYRHDALLKRVVHNRNHLNHFKQYRPYWNEKAPFVDMLQRTRSSELSPLANQQNSLRSQFYLKQSENRPQLDGDIAEQNRDAVDSINRLNDPPVSEVTFTSYDRPTRSHLDKIYIGYFTSDNDPASGITDQGDNKEISSDYTENRIYYFDSDEPIKYDPTVYYNLVSLGYRDEDGVDQYSDDQIIDFNSSSYLRTYLYGNPATGDLFLNKSSNYSYPHNKYNYLSYKTSKVHKLWFSNTHLDRSLSNSGDLFNQAGNSSIYVYTENSINLEYIILGIYDENDKRVDFSSGSITCSVKNHKYSLVHSEFIDSNDNPVTAAYVLFMVRVIPGAMDETNGSSIETDMRVHYSGTMPAMIHGSVTEIAREEED